MARSEPRRGPAGRTATSPFGVSRREGHDASSYYGSRLYEGLTSHREVGVAQPMPDHLRNRILCGDSRALPLPDNCVHLVVTSPPYNASKDYDEDLSSRNISHCSGTSSQSVSASSFLVDGWSSMSRTSVGNRTSPSRAM